MRVWTQQNLEFWEELERDGIAYCKQESWLYKEYDFAYDWLVGQMHIRLSTPPKVEIKLPLWCWVQYKNYKSRKPRFSPSRDDGGYHAEVMIEADIPDELLLQSNFYLWSYCCMNGWLIGDETLEKELDVYEKTNGIEYGYKFQELPKEYQERIKKSW